MKKRRISLSILSIVLTIALLVLPAGAYSYRSVSQILPTANDLKSVSKSYSGDYLVTYDTISSTYECDIIQFTPKFKNSYTMNVTHAVTQKGYFAIRTESSIDTVGRLYKLNSTGALWWKEYQVENFTPYADDYKGDSNYRIIVRVDSGESFYIATRAYNLGTGNYRLIVEPNDDVLFKSQGAGKGAIWRVDSDGKFYHGDNYYESQVEYYTKEQTLAFYMITCDQALASLSKDAMIRRSAKGKIQALYECGSITMDVISAFLGPEVVAANIVKDVAKVVGALAADQVFSTMLDHIYGATNTEDIADLKYELELSAGCCCCKGLKFSNMTGLRVVTTEKQTNYSANRIFCSKSYDADMSTTYRGIDYEKGTWTIK